MLHLALLAAIGYGRANGAPAVKPMSSHHHWMMEDSQRAYSNAWSEKTSFSFELQGPQKQHTSSGSHYIPCSCCNGTAATVLLSIRTVSALASSMLWQWAGHLTLRNVFLGPTFSPWIISQRYIYSHRHEYSGIRSTVVQWDWPVDCVPSSKLEALFCKRLLACVYPYPFTLSTIFCWEVSNVSLEMYFLALLNALSASVLRTLTSPRV